jgi:hypothetical protein
LRSTELAQNWRKISHTDQKNKIEQLNELEEKQQRVQMRAADRGMRASRRSGDGNLTRTPPMKHSTKKKSRLEHQVVEDGVISSIGHTTDPPPPPM